MARKPHSVRRRSCAGQAMAEFLAGLVAIMFLIVGLQQVALLSEKNFNLHHKVRGSLAEQLTTPGSDYIEGFVFAEKTSVGADGLAYTGDDRVVVGSDDVYTGSFGVMYAIDYGEASGYLADYSVSGRDNDPYARLEDSGGSVSSKNFSMFYAEGRVSVEVVPYFRNVLGRDSINLKQQAWMPAWDRL